MKHLISYLIAITTLSTNIIKVKLFTVNRLTHFSMSTSNYILALDKFCIRQFNNNDYTGTQVNYNPIEFEATVNKFYESGNYPLVDGYAPFCKHIFIPNFCDIKCGYKKISDENKHLIRSGYEARKEKELPVLIQYFDRTEVQAPTATHLDIILYSREQIINENIAMGDTPPDSTAPWGIISVKGQLDNFELPMQPITIMRNALGKEYGGSGVPIDEIKYRESVQFWTDNCAIK